MSFLQIISDKICIHISFMHIRYFLTTHYFYSIILTLFVKLIIKKFFIIQLHPLCFIFSYDVAAQSGPWYPLSRGFYATHYNVPQSIGLVWMSDPLVTQTSTWQHTTLTTNFYDPGGIQTHNIGRTAATDLQLKLCGHWDRQFSLYSSIYTHIFTLLHFCLVHTLR
jgi:hypothetical protein